MTREIRDADLTAESFRAFLRALPPGASAGLSNHSRGCPLVTWIAVGLLGDATADVAVWSGCVDIEGTTFPLPAWARLFYPRIDDTIPARTRVTREQALSALDWALTTVPGF